MQLGLLLLVELCKHCPANLAQVVRASPPRLLPPFYMYIYTYRCKD